MPADNNRQVALVTGATGFVGSHLAHRLCRDGWQVHAIVRPSSRLHLLEDMIDRVSVHTHDGTMESMSAIVSAVRPTLVFHLASCVRVQHQPADLVPLLESNITFGTQLIEAMATQEIYQLVNTGTSWQHFDNRDYSPVNLYAATKQAFEAILQCYTETTPLRIVTLKLFDTYGPNDPRKKLFSLLRETARTGQPLAMSPGEQLIDAVYIDDVIEAFMISAERLRSQRVAGQESYAVSSGTHIPLKEFVSLVERETNTRLPVEWGAKEYRPREVMVPWTGGPQLPGWRPQVGLTEGIRRSWSG